MVTTNTSKARKIHFSAEFARENSQDFIKALQLAQKAMVLYQEENDDIGFSECLLTMFITLKHLYKDTNYSPYKKYAKYVVEAAIEIAKKSRNKSAVVKPYFHMGEVYSEFYKDYKKSRKYFQMAIDAFVKYPPKEHSRKSVLLNFEVHLYHSEYLSGNKSAYKKLAQVIKELESENEDKYTKDVWVSGGYLKLAEILSIDNPLLSKRYLEKAKKIILTNDDLSLRKKQLVELENKLG